MSAPLAGRRVLVVGGETALGRAVAVGLAERGADVAIASLTPDTQAEFAVNSALNELWALGRRGLALAVDASDAGALGEAVERAVRELGALDAVAVAAPEGASLALEAFGALPVVVLRAGGSAEDAIEAVAAAVG